MGPFRRQNPVSSSKEEERKCWRMEVDIEAILNGQTVSTAAFLNCKNTYFNTRQYSPLVDIVVASIHDAFGIWPAFLRRSNRSPKNSFATTTSITGRCQYQCKNKQQR